MNQIPCVGRTQPPASIRPLDFNEPPQGDPFRLIGVIVGLGYGTALANQPDLARDHGGRNRLYRRWLDAARLVLPASYLAWITAQLSLVEVFVCGSEDNRRVALEAAALLAGGAL